MATLLIFSSGGALAMPREKQTADGKVISFRQEFAVGSDSIVPGNDLRRFGFRVDSLVSAGAVGNINITGIASPDGNRIQNEILASGRAMAMKNWFTAATDLDAGRILLFTDGDDWEMLQELVAADPDVPERQKALSIIGSASSDAKKLRSLKELSDGATWTYLVRHILPQMRVAVVRLEVLPVRQEMAPVEYAGNVVSPSASSGMVTESAEIVEEPFEEPLAIEEPETVVAAVTDDCYGQRMALKSNILYDAALMPSLELEYKINGRWSVALEGNVAWWKNDRKHKYYQIATIIPEVKYHFNHEKGWLGHYLGLFVGGGKYDLENGKKGYYGEGGMLGVSYNYVFNVGKNISFEAGLGVGALYSRYKQYVPVNGKYLYQQTKNLWYGGPLRVKFAIVWRFWDQKCKGGDR